MKKILVVILIILSAIGLFACKPKDKNVDLTKNVSYYQTHLYSGENTDFQVTVTIGKKEEIFIADGKTDNLKDFATVSVTPLNLNLAGKTFTFALIADGGEVSGELKRDMISNSYIANVELGELRNKIKSIKIYYNSVTVDIPLSNKLTNVLTWQQILDIATKEFQDVIKANLDDKGQLQREICIKYIRDKRNPNSPYYWYISFIGNDNTYWALLIDPVTGQIITKKI